VFKAIDSNNANLLSRTSNLLAAFSNNRRPASQAIEAGMFSQKIRRVTFFMLLASLFAVCVALMGCSASHSASTNSAPASAAPSISVSPSSASIQVWQSVQFSVSGDTSGASCTWQAAQPTILAKIGSGQFQGGQPGTTQVSVTCGTLSATASVVVSVQQPSGPVVITAGGTYSGNWNSTDPKTPAVTIKTDAPVTIQNSAITSKGGLIDISGVKTGANVTVENVTGTALDPGVSGMQRGAFISAVNVASLVVKQCTIKGASFGVKLVGSSPATLEISNNLANDLEDRASDGNGGLRSTRPQLGHFIIIAGVSASAGAEIAWNQAVQTIGQTSTEDVINIYNSQGAVGHPIWVHDNYLEGASSAATSNYTGTSLITDGAGTNSAPPSAYVLFDTNEIVATAGTGIAIAAGHDVQATNNRVVSCGVSNTGTWYAIGRPAVYIWNYYKITQFYNNTITGTAGGMVGLGTNNVPKAFDSWINTADMNSPGTSISGNDFTDPCLVSGSVNLKAEDAERAYWTAKVAGAGQQIGDQHMN
jgi:hypothetical protein